MEAAVNPSHTQIIAEMAINYATVSFYVERLDQPIIRNGYEDHNDSGFRFILVWADPEPPKLAPVGG